MLRAPALLLASGGYGQLYASTTNPDTATGDGVALALRAGAPAADLEFVQFHPTVLYDGPATGRRPLVTEAVRGEGAVLLDRAGRRFMTGVHPLADLAPRDVVAAAITRQLAEHRRRLRVPGRPRDRRVRAAVPHRVRGLPGGRDRPGDRADPGHPGRALRVRRGGHRPAGRTAVPGLYAAGEVARTGLHGANRLASNSLLEGLVMGARAVRGGGRRPGRGPRAGTTRPSWPPRPRCRSPRARWCSGR